MGLFVSLAAHFGPLRPICGLFWALKGSENLKLKLAIFVRSSLMLSKENETSGGHISSTTAVWEIPLGVFGCPWVPSSKSRVTFFKEMLLWRGIQGASKNPLRSFQLHEVLELWPRQVSVLNGKYMGGPTKKNNMISCDF